MAVLISSPSLIPADTFDPHNTTEQPLRVVTARQPEPNPTQSNEGIKLSEEDLDRSIARVHQMIEYGSSFRQACEQIASETGITPRNISKRIRNHQTGKVLSEHTENQPTDIDYRAARIVLLGSSCNQAAKKCGLTFAMLSRKLKTLIPEIIGNLDLQLTPSTEFQKLRRTMLRKKLSPGEVLGAYPPGEGKKGKAPKDVDPIVADLYDIPLLTREQTVYLFRKYNFLKYCASTLRQRSSREPDVKTAQAIYGLATEASETRNLLVVSNRRLVVSIAKRYRNEKVGLDELLSVGEEGLFSAVEKFDHERGNRFSTYATWVIRRSLSNAYGSKRKERQHLVEYNGQEDDVFFAIEDQAENNLTAETIYRHHKETITRLFDCLTVPERELIRDHYGLGKRDPIPNTILGPMIGLSKQGAQRRINVAREKMALRATRTKLKPVFSEQTVFAQSSDATHRQSFTPPAKGLRLGRTARQILKILEQSPQAITLGEIRVQLTLKETLPNDITREQVDEALILLRTHDLATASYNRGMILFSRI